MEQKNWALGASAHGGCLSPIRHRGRAGIVEPDLGVAVVGDELLQPFPKLISKVRDGAKVTEKYDTAATPFQRADRYDGVTRARKKAMAKTYEDLNPAAIQRQIQALTSELLTLTISKAAARQKPAVAKTAKRAFPDESTNQARRAI